MLGFIVAYLAAHLLSAGSLPAEQASDSPVKIFILAGQSNMVGRGVVDDASVPGTMAHLVANDPDYAFLGDGDGGYKVLDDVWIRYGAASGPLTAGYGSSSSTIGPELGFGHKVGALYDEQVLLIKYAVGGRSLGNDFRGDLGVPDLPFVIATSAMDPHFDYTQVERAQLAMADPARHPAFDGNVKVVDARQEYNGLTFWQLFS